MGQAQRAGLGAKSQCSKIRMLKNAFQHKIKVILKAKVRF